MSLCVCMHMKERLKEMVMRVLLWYFWSPKNEKKSWSKHTSTFSAHHMCVMIVYTAPYLTVKGRLKLFYVCIHHLHMHTWRYINTHCQQAPFGDVCLKKDSYYHSKMSRYTCTDRVKEIRVFRDKNKWSTCEQVSSPEKEVCQRW